MTRRMTFSIMMASLATASFQVVAADHIDQGYGKEDEQCEDCEDVGHDESPMEQTAEAVVALPRNTHVNSGDL